jgi:hypothetical protein
VIDDELIAQTGRVTLRLPRDVRWLDLQRIGRREFPVPARIDFQDDAARQALAAQRDLHVDHAGVGSEVRPILDVVVLRRCGHDGRGHHRGEQQEQGNKARCRHRACSLRTPALK